MKTIQINEPHGYCTDTDGNVCFKFGNARDELQVPDATETVTYVDSPAAHGVDICWTYHDFRGPPVSLELSSTSIINDGSDSVTISLTLNLDAETNRDVTLTIDESKFSKTLSPGDTDTEEITTQKDAGTKINIEVSGPDIQTATSEIEVTSS